ncbi:hypothetical protein BT69DRAFT_1248348 [Atractiella rhizophila]|nr:hypothetical protein BT69DRAFT_1248348 [Atractiella rhizophila]
MAKRVTRQNTEIVFPEKLNKNLDFSKAAQRLNNYTKQYAALYFARLTKLGPRCASRAAAKWGSGEELVMQVERVLDMPKDTLCFITGTVFMDMSMKPNVLTELAKQHQLVAPVGTSKYYGPDKASEDHITLEDSSGRIALEFKGQRKWPLVTGLIISVLGRQTESGTFQVEDICFPGLSKQKAHDDAMEGVDEEERWVALVSGLEFGAPESEGGEERLDLLQEWLTGEAAGEEERHMISHISAFLIAGNSMVSPPPNADDLPPSSVTTKKGKNAPSSNYTNLPPAHLSRFLSPLLPSLPTILQTGPRDPSSVLLPQPPLHPSLLPPPAGNFGDRSLKLVGNPCWIDVGGKRILSGGGTNVSDVERYIPDEDGSGIETAQRLLDWAHDAPTAPDTLACYPFQNTDPFVMDACPDLYVVGNQQKFETRLMEGEQGQKVRIVMLPRFRQTGELVLVSLKSLDVKVVKFGE